MQKITPFLWFNDRAEEAIEFYTSLFANSKIESVSRYGEGGPGPDGQVMTGTFKLLGQEFMALNGGPSFSFTPANSFFVNCQTEAEIDRLWQALSENGAVLMELGAYPFSKKFGFVNDQFGLSWQLNLADFPPKIIPFLMFVGEHAGKAEEAIHFYTSLFKDASIANINRHGPDQGEVEGTVMHAIFYLEGQEFMAMDSSYEHKFNFTEAVSYFVNCQTQAEVDNFWEKLSEGGEKGRCGWLKDKYGVSWQIVPAILGELLSDPDPEKAGRVTQAMLQMTKLEIGQLQQAALAVR